MIGLYSSRIWITTIQSSTAYLSELLGSWSAISQRVGYAHAQGRTWKDVTEKIFKFSICFFFKVSVKNSERNTLFLEDTALSLDPPTISQIAWYGIVF